MPSRTISAPSRQDPAGAPGAAVPFDLEAALRAARAASRRLPRLDRRAALLAVADRLEADEGPILDANRGDVAAARTAGTPDALVDRLELDGRRLAAMAAAVRAIAELPEPLGRTLEGRTLASGVRLRKVTVPFGVVAMIYESRPNVTVDAAALALRAGSAAVLRGSASALASNRALVAAVRAGLRDARVPEDAVVLVDDPDRDLVTRLLRARGQVDLAIPRGGAGLIEHVVRTAQVPTIETGVGNCHVYVHEDADAGAAERIALNAKVQRPGVCNAMETLLVHAGIAERLLPGLLRALHGAGVRLHGCTRAAAAAAGAGVPMAEATERDWETEYLDLELAVRVVDGLDAALDHIDRYGTKHSEAIVTRSLEAARRFADEVDAAAVLVNASTRFTDGFEFGLGAEIGISTQKMHARGPMGLAELVTHKFVLEGDGAVRS